MSPNREAIVPLAVRGPSGLEHNAEFTIDTGFTDFLTLPEVTVSSLGLLHAGSIRVELADGSAVDLESYLVEVHWDGAFRTVSSLAVAGGPLVGMSMLYGWSLHIDVIDGGAVEVSAL